jgi:type VI secretion system protein ImpI
MALRLAIENETNLPDGGPVTFTVAGKRTIDIGRDQHLDWTLPDPSRFISGKHCEISFRDGGYWLTDVSTNGTFLNGADQRMRGPHRLRTGDRFIIGQYIILAELDTEGGAERGFAASPAAPTGMAAQYENLWTDEGGVAPPIDPKQLKIPAEAARPVHAEFLDWAASVPSADPLRPPPVSQPMQTPQAGQPPFAPDIWDVSPPQPDRIAASVSPPPSVLTKEPPWNEPGEAPPTAQPSPFLAAAEPVAQRPAEAIRPVPPFQAVPADSERGVADAAILQTLAEAAGLPNDIFSGADQREVAQQLGMALRSSVEGVMQLLKARNQAKQMTRSSSHTTIQATGNNPLKFSPTAQDALRIMFSGKTRGYLDAQTALQQTFVDLQSHQLRTYAALQHALMRLTAGLDPATIARDVENKKAGSFLTSKKARNWDAYQARWTAQMLPESGGPLAAFMLHFADFYDGNDKSGA